MLLAQGGDDSGSGSGSDSGSGGSGAGSTSYSGGSGSGSETGTSSNTETTSPLISTTVSANTEVDCVGPDGKRFTTEFHDCQELNQKWGNTTFSFTPLANSGQESPEPTETPKEASHTNLQTPKGKLEIEVEGNKRKINFVSKGLHIEFKSEDNGTVSAVAKQKDGKEIKLASEDALTALNEQLKDQDIEISSAEGGLTFKKGNVEAQTHFPLSVDPTTGQLTVTTPAGSKVVTVLPDRAVQNLLASGIFTGVNSHASSESAGTTQQIQLTDVNGSPVFQIEGVLSKKLFGLFPVSFSKTAFVSAEDGHTISIQQSPLVGFLEALSF